MTITGDTFVDAHSPVPRSSVFDGEGILDVEGRTEDHDGKNGRRDAGRRAGFSF